MAPDAPRSNAWYTVQLVRRGWIDPWSGQPVYPREPQPDLIDLIELAPGLALGRGDRLDLTYTIAYS